MMNQIADLFTGITDRKKDHRVNIAVYICTILACLVPRYISALKIHVGLNISLFTVSTVIVFFLVTKKFKFRFKLETMIFLVWFILVLGSVWRAKKIGIWAYYVIWIFSACLYQQLLLVRENQNIFHVICRALVDALFLHLLMGLYEIMTHSYLFEIGDNISSRRYGYVAIGMFHNLNDYATFVTTIFPFALFFLFTSKNLVSKIYYAVISALSVYMMLNSQSRGVLLALVLLIGACVYLLLKQSGWPRVLAVIGIILAVMTVIFIPSIHNYLLDVVTGDAFENTDSSDTARINLIKNGLYFLKETHGFGTGAGNLYWWLDERSIYPVRGLNFMHNWYVEVLATFGIGFFLIYMIWHINLLISLFRSTKINKGFWNINNTIALSFVGFTIVSISSSSNVYSEWVWMYLVFVSTYCLFRTKPLFRL